MGQGKAERFANYLRGRGSAEELAAATPCGAAAAAQLRALLQRDQPTGEASPGRLDGSRVLAFLSRKSNASRNQHAREIVHRSQGDHHCGKALVARRYAEHAASIGKR